MEIRVAREDDLPALARLEHCAFPNPWSAASLAAELLQPTSFPLLVEDLATQPRISAYLIIRLLGEEAELLRLAVHPHRRRQGLGRALLGHALAELTRRRIKCCFLEVRADNGAALELYRRFPVQLISRRPAYYRDGSEALVLSLQTESPIDSSDS